MSQHRTLGDPRRAARVLEDRDVVSSYGRLGSGLWGRLHEVDEAPDPWLLGNREREMARLPEIPSSPEGVELPERGREEVRDVAHDHPRN